MATQAIFRIWRGDAAAAHFRITTRQSTRAWWFWMRSTASRPSRRPTSPCDGTAKPASAGPVPPRSTACRADVHDAAQPLNLNMPVIVEPMHAFPSIRDLVTDVSWNFRVKKTIKQFKPRPPDAPDGTWRMQQADVDRVQEFRKCIECFLCQDVCHVLREHHKHDEFIGPRFLVYAAALEMHPLDTEDRIRI